MGGVFKSWKWWWNTLRKFFLDKRVVRGQMSLGYGDHQIVVPVNGKPLAVSLSLEEPDDANLVCMGNINLGGAKVIPDGFILYARIQSNTCIVRWLVELDGLVDPEDLLNQL